MGNLASDVAGDGRHAIIARIARPNVKQLDDIVEGWRVVLASEIERSDGLTDHILFFSLDSYLHPQRAPVVGVRVASGTRRRPSQPIRRAPPTQGGCRLDLL